MENLTNERNAPFFRFEDLRIYHKALDYIKWVHRATETMTNQEYDNLAIRFNESARAIAMNIAEGSARNKSQFIYYLKMAKSSVRESLVYTTTAFELGYIDDKQEQESRSYLMELTKMIGALISSLQRSVAGTHESEEIDIDVSLDGHGVNPDNF
jgi:four helix bundle protein